MNFRPEQAQAIRRWGEATPYVKEIRLFGSRATGHATESSDIDLAVTIGGNDPGTVRGNYYALSERWQHELTQLLGEKVHIGLYNDPDGTIVRDSCDKCSVLLFP